MITRMFSTPIDLIKVTQVSDSAGAYTTEETQEVIKVWFEVLSSQEQVLLQQKGVGGEARIFTEKSVNIGINDKVKIDNVIYDVVGSYTVVSPYSGLNYNYYDLKRVVHQ